MRRVVTRETTVFDPGLLRLMYSRIHDAGLGPYPTRVGLALQTPVLGYHTMRGDINPADYRFYPQVVEVVDVWKHF